MLSLVIKILLIFTLLDLTRGQEDSPTFSINPSWAHVLKNITIPDIPRKKVGEGTCSNSNCSPGECNTCWETCGSCPGDKEIYGCKNPQHWSLTFDDGPTKFTMDLLLALNRLNIKATFFVLGKNVQQFPDLLKSIHENGHEIGSHTWSHSHLMSLSNEEIVAEVKATEEEIFKVIQVKPKYIRVPYGEIDERIRGILTALGYEIVFWNLDTQDWQLENKEYTQDENQLLEKFRNISHNSTNSSGFISLQHEFLPITSQSLPKIHQILQNKKFDLVSLDQCLGNTPLEIPSEVQEAKPMEDITGSTEEVPFEEIPAQDTPTRESSAQDTPTGESSVQGTPTEENSQDTPIEENSAQENKTEEDSDYEEPTEMINVNSSEEFEITKIPTFIDDLSERQYLISNYGSVITPKAVILKVTFGVLIWILIN